MYITRREQKLFMILKNYSDGVSINYIKDSLNISKRTAYRTISDLKDTLESSSIQIYSDPKNGYKLKADKSEIENFENTYIVADSIGIDMQVDTRREALMCYLSEKPSSIEDIGKEFGVSPSTILSDIDTSKQKLQQYEINIDKNEANQFYISGNERNIRDLLSEIVTSNINSVTFFSKEWRTDKESEMWFVNFIDVQYIDFSLRVLEEIIENNGYMLRDKELKYLSIYILIAVKRMKNSFFIASNMEESKADEDSNVTWLKNLFENKFDIAIPNEEFEHLLDLIRNRKQLSSDNILDTDFNINLAYRIGLFINEVSEESGVDFYLDSSLYIDLYGHLQRTLQKKIPFNYDQDTLEEFQHLHPKLFDIISVGLEEIFVNYAFSENEKALIMLYFLSSLEKNDTYHNQKILLVSSNKMGMVKVLKNRIKSSISGVDDIVVAKLSELDTIEFSQFDVVLSTEVLGRKDIDYVLISPILTDKEIKEIESKIYAKEKKNNLSFSVSVDAGRDAFEDLYLIIEYCKTILAGFQISDLHNSSDMSIKDMLKNIFEHMDNGYVTDIDGAVKDIYRRYQLSPIGIPKTNLGLFHGISEFINRPLFVIFQLDQSTVIASMDGETIDMQRILLLVAPANVKKWEKEVLGEISGAIIENIYETQIYMRGNQRDIYNLICFKFLDFIRRKIK